MNVKIKSKSSINRVMAIQMDNDHIELDITYKPSDYNDGDAKVNLDADGKLRLVYLTHDDSAQNPLDDFDGEGKIFTSRRDSNTHAEMQEALGLDGNWQPDLYHSACLEILTRLVTTGLKSEKALRTQLGRILLKHEGNSQVNKKIYEACNDMDDSVDFEDLFSRYFTGIYYASKLPANECSAMRDLAAIATTNIQNAWLEAKSLGLIGNPLAMKLDCYQHSGICYSLSGTGMQCRFDTSSGVAVWVPDDCALDNIKIQTAKALGIEIKTVQTACIGILKEHNKPWVLSVMGKEFSDWENATDYALSKLDPAVVREKQLEIAREFAVSSVELYNAWLNGDCYGLVDMTFVKNGDDWEEESEEVNWGIVGYDGAISELNSYFKTEPAAPANDEVKSQ